MRTPRWRRATLVVASTLLCAGCGLMDAGSSPSSPDGADRRGTESAVPDSSAETAPLTWGPTPQEVEQASRIIADWTPEQLAGQVIVGRYHSTDPEVPAQMVRELHLAGVSVTNGNVLDAEQVRATTSAVSAAVAEDGRDFPAVIGVDEEGGSVAHLRGIASTFPAFRSAGDAVDRDRAEGGREGRRVVREAARASGLELRSLGFTWVFAPVGDVTIGSADPTIGSRSPSSDPRTAATATAAAVRGYVAAGIVSTPKHFPGHGGATADSHEVLPTLSTGLEELRQRDLLPFKTSIRAGAPAIMMSHLDVQALEPGLPATLAPRVYDFLRQEMGFEGVAITDSLGMGAVADLPLPAVRAVQAGADLLLMPADTVNTHRTVTAAIRSGEITPERIQEAAGRVVALQLWQQRMSQELSVPEDAAERAEAAASELEAAAW
ncbi:glycoside hydrolase family 3 N-terminal domain-containing protein [Nocardioides houyundeii]|uniref:glycoside hydrolase family 3 N-terminal domain-containing protein n=1 Tax=Nocardioides houyundeii TaxID=2045452 RepID=UPI0013154655|nr:glycoside hydrolase family 3 N-terminal domain-containing protein [Nocardioides houyundeii]